jgi:phage terminase small subunit
MSKAKLTDRQLKVIPHIVSSSTDTEGCKKAKINKTTLYKWLKGPEFKTELERQRDEIVAEAFGALSQSLTKAVETLASLLDNKDGRLKRLAAKNVIDFVIRHKEIEDLDKRLAEIEQRLDQQKR